MRYIVWKSICILILGGIITTFLFKSDSQSSSVARKVLAGFLKQKETDISCSILKSDPEATIVKCTHCATNYIVKFFSTTQVGKNEIAWTQHASGLSIGPKLYYADPTNRYMISEFAKGNSLTPATSNSASVIKNIATTLARLHHSFAPFAHESDMFTRIYEKYKKLHSSGKLKNMLEDRLQEVKKIEAYIQGLAVSPVPCHNDLNPGNIFLNNNQVTLIDWGDAALSNPYYEIAAFFVLNIITTENQKLFFEHYEAQIPNPQCYLYLYKQVVYFEFALNLLLGVQAERSELLQAPQIKRVNDINYYLTLLAEQHIKIDAIFLYNMAIASLNKMVLNLF